MRTNIEKSAIFLLRLLKVPVEWLGVDYNQFEILLVTKLTLDFRSTPAGVQTMGSRKRTLANQLLMYTIFGLFFGIAAFSIGDLTMSLTIFYTVIMVSLIMTLISEFTTVLFDQRDNYILLPRPVSNRTILFFRIVHIQFYIGLIALAFSLPTGIIVAFKFSIETVVVYFIAVGLVTWISLIFTSFIYLLISKIVNGERFKDIISYVQIVFAVLIFGSYQLLPRLMDTMILKNVSMSVKWWTCFFPPAWFAALVKLSQFNEITSHFILLSILAVIVPITGAVILVRSLSHGFGNILSEGSSESIKLQKDKNFNSGLINRLKTLFCVSDIEKAGWNFTMATTRRDRKFKQSVYPYFGMMLVLAVVILKPDLTNLVASIQGKNDFSRYFFIIIFGFAVNVAMLHLPYTDTPEAAWIYRALPFSDHGHLMTGAVKAVLVRFLVPVYFFISIPSIIFWGISVIPQIVLSGLCNVVLVLIMITFQSDLPFTRLREMQQKGTNSLKAFFNMLLMFVVAGLVYLTSLIPASITMLVCCLFIGFAVILFRHIRKKHYVLT